MWKLQCGFLWTICVVQTRDIERYIYSIFFCVWETWGQGCCLWQSGRLMSNRSYGLYFTCSASLNCWNVSVQALWSSVCNLFCGSRNTYIFFKPLSHFSIFKCLVYPDELCLRCICLLRWFMEPMNLFHFHLCKTWTETVELEILVPVQNLHVTKY